MDSDRGCGDLAAHARQTPPAVRRFYHYCKYPSPLYNKKPADYRLVFLFVRVFPLCNNEVQELTWDIYSLDDLLARKVTGDFCIDTSKFSGSSFITIRRS
jgi:hypothetical protein